MILSASIYYRMFHNIKLLLRNPYPEPNTDIGVSKLQKVRDVKNFPWSYLTRCSYYLPKVSTTIQLQNFATHFTRHYAGEEIRFTYEQTIA